MNRRKMLGTAVKGAAALVLAPVLTRATAGAAFFNRNSYRLFANSDQTYSTRAIDLVQRATVIDMLAPLWISPSHMTDRRAHV